MPQIVVSEDDQNSLREARSLLQDAYSDFRDAARIIRNLTGTLRAELDLDGGAISTIDELLCDLETSVSVAEDNVEIGYDCGRCGLLTADDELDTYEGTDEDYYGQPLCPTCFSLTTEEEPKEDEEEN